MVSAGTMARIGASRYSGLSAPFGTNVSLNMNLTASAIAWNSPKGPSRFGPGRSWIIAAPRRSTQTMTGAAWSSKTNHNSIFTASAVHSNAAALMPHRLRSRWPR